MEKVKEYKIISTVEQEEFIEQVNQHLQDGWHLYGGPFARPITSGSARYSQAVIKYETKSTGPDVTFV